MGCYGTLRSPIDIVQSGNTNNSVGAVRRAKLKVDRDNFISINDKVSRLVYTSELNPTINFSHFPFFFFHFLNISIMCGGATPNTGFLVRAPKEFYGTLL